MNPSHRPDPTPEESLNESEFRVYCPCFGDKDASTCLGCHDNIITSQGK